MLGPQLARVAEIYQHEGYSGIYAKIQNYEYPWTQPNVAWETSSPESLGLGSVSLEELKNDLAGKNTEAFLVIRNGQIAYEWYGPDSSPNSTETTAAMAKAVIASMALAAAESDGLIDLDDPAWKYIPDWEDDPLKSQITLRQLGSHSSGLDDVDFPPSEGDAEWKHVYYNNRDLRFPLSMSRTPVIVEPGTQYSYSGVGYYALAYALTSSLQDTRYTDIYSLLDNRLMKPMQIPATAWSLSYKESYDIDGMKLYAFGSGSRQTARAIARIGQLVLDEGEWNGEQLVEPSAIENVTSYEGANPGRTANPTRPAMGIGWLVNSDGFFPSLPEDAIIGMGNGPQLTLVVPSLDLVAVRLGGPLTESPEPTSSDLWGSIENIFFRPLMAAVESE